MEAFKVYKCTRNLGQYSLQITVGDKKQFVTFKNIGHGSVYSTGAPKYKTSEKDVQEAIEDSRAFKKGTIVLESSMSLTRTKTDEENHVDKEGDESGVELVTYDEVTKFREAQDILTSPPYNVPKTSQEITSKERVHAKAAELGISFPNLK